MCTKLFLHSQSFNDRSLIFEFTVFQSGHQFCLLICIKNGTKTSQNPDRPILPISQVCRKERTDIYIKSLVQCLAQSKFSATVTLVPFPKIRIETKGSCLLAYSAHFSGTVLGFMRGVDYFESDPTPK